MYTYVLTLTFRSEYCIAPGFNCNKIMLKLESNLFLDSCGIILYIEMKNKNKYTNKKLA